MNKDDDLIQKLSQKVKDLQVDYNDARAELYQANKNIERFTENLLKERIKTSHQTKQCEQLKIQVADLEENLIVEKHN